jgi:hypothetical protein
MGFHTSDLAIDIDYQVSELACRTAMLEGIEHAQNVKCDGCRVGGDDASSFVCSDVLPSRIYNPGPHSISSPVTYSTLFNGRYCNGRFCHLSESLCGLLSHQILAHAVLLKHCTSSQ